MGLDSNDEPDPWCPCCGKPSGVYGMPGVLCFECRAPSSRGTSDDKPTIADGLRADGARAERQRLIEKFRRRAADLRRLSEREGDVCDASMRIVQARQFEAAAVLIESEGAEP